MQQDMILMELSSATPTFFLNKNGQIFGQIQKGGSVNGGLMKIGLWYFENC